MIQLRDYQQRIIDDLMDWFYANPEGNPIINACVGAGKSIVIAKWIHDILAMWPDQRIVMLTASKELVQQNYEKLIAIWPDAPVGINCAGLGQKNKHAQIVFSTINSIHRHAYDIEPFNIGIVDECHNINTSETGMYRDFLKAQKLMNPRFRLVGLTGTPFRGNGVWLWQGESPIFSEIAAQVTMTQLLKDGYLSPLVVADTDYKVDTSNIKTNMGDYVARDLAKALDVPEVVDSACRELVKTGSDRKSWLVFGVNVQHAEHIQETLVSMGINAKVLTQKTNKSDRESMINDFKNGHIRALVNVGVLTVGFDAPNTDLIALMRPTKSPVLYVQIAGRGMRIAPGKKDCLWLDFSDTTETIGPVNLVSGRNHRKKSNQDAPCKSCPDCGHICPASATQCPECKYEFPKPDPIKHRGFSGEASVIALETPKPEWIDVQAVRYYKHQRPGKRPSLRVEYQCGLKIFKEWVCLEHSGIARAKAVDWWKDKSIKEPPHSVDDALEYAENGYIDPPTNVLVKREGKYDRVIATENEIRVD